MKKTDFTTETIYFQEPSSGFILFSDLISLISDEEQMKFLTDRFNPDGEELRIQIGKCDLAYRAVKKVVKKFTYINSIIRNNQISTFLVQNNDELDADLQDMMFEISDVISELGESLQNIKCRAIYNSKNQFYDELKLSSHINFLIKDNKYEELQKLNSIWINHKDFDRKRKFKLLKSASGSWFARSITSVGFKEYGTAFSFVFTILLLNEIEQAGTANNFTIEALNLNESKISMNISQGVKRKLDDIGYVQSSIHMFNNDLGTTSFKMVRYITLIPNVSSPYLLNIESPNKVGKMSIKTDHRTTLGILNDKFSTISEGFWSLEEFENDFYSILKAKNPQGLRSVLEQKIINSPILNKSGELKDLFNVYQSDIIDDMAKLINLCGKADALNIDYDLKSKLREIIAEVLWTKKN